MLTLKKNLHSDTLNTNAHYTSILSTAMSWTLIEDSVYVYDGRYLATIFVLSYIFGSHFCVIVRLNAMRASIYTSTCDGKRSFSPPGS